jgi:NAD(P)-dependent dehydrogenase (short-subunit alcohol dehydrogenase family)
VKTLLITGGTGSLGTDVVKRLERDYRCVLLTRKQADLTDAPAVRAALADVGPIYGLVHLAGGWAGGKVAETDDATWSQMIGMNLTAAFNVIRETLPHLERPGRIVAISSISSIKRSPGAAAYSASKAALNALIEVVAAEMHGTGITANALLPNTLGGGAGEVSHDNVAEAIAFLLSDAAANVTGALVPMR